MTREKEGRSIRSSSFKQGKKVEADSEKQKEGTLKGNASFQGWGGVKKGKVIKDEPGRRVCSAIHFLKSLKESGPLWGGKGKQAKSLLRKRK